jgi:hypothetical protein
MRQQKRSELVVCSNELYLAVLLLSGYDDAMIMSADP